MAMNQVFEGSMKLTHIQWDLFTPLGLQPPLRQIQSKIYAEKFKIQ
ncbi:MAG: hypothetical protein BECKG1743D_GA0114223_111382 [Candidatus Kentron sp. G]|nr:MAG: hypothetical protein BECKG1743D_GA0114223_111382 [Candidatus Kentron sp. G]